MAYQIKQLAQLAGVSVRTLRYYDEIGLLPPAYLGDNGYRYYETAQVDRLQQICLYRSLQVPLADIPALLDQPTATVVMALEQQYQKLLAQRQQLDTLLALVQTTIKTQRGGVAMTDKDKFTAFKQAKLAENEANYGDELRGKYEEQTLTQANDQFAKLSTADYAAMQATEQQLIADLKVVLASEDVTTVTAQRVYRNHKKWLSYTWPKYTAVMHRNLALMYQADERFQAYYDKRAGQGASAVLCAIIDRYAQD